MHLGGQHMACVAVPEPVQRHPPMVQKIRHDVRKAAGLQGGAVRLGDHVPAIIRPHPELKQFLALQDAPAAQFFDGKGWQGDCASSPALGFLFPNRSSICLFGAGDHGQLPIVQIDGLPPQGGDFSAAQPAQGSQYQWNE